MLRRALFALGAIVVMAVAFVAGGLFLAGWGIRSVDPELPSLDELLTYDPAADLPVRISWLNTASQKMPRSAVLDPGQDPTPDAPNDGHTVCAEGRTAGSSWSTRHGRRVRSPFGKVIETFRRRAAHAARVHGREAGLDPARERTAFTHEHVDHTNGVVALVE
jgi:hypothetical protein